MKNFELKKYYKLAISYLIYYSGTIFLYKKYKYIIKK